jgi:hypothetical protein
MYKTGIEITIARSLARRPPSDHADSNPVAVYAEGQGDVRGDPPRFTVDSATELMKERFSEEPDGMWSDQRRKVDAERSDERDSQPPLHRPFALEHR